MLSTLHSCPGEAGGGDGPPSDAALDEGEATATGTGSDSGGDDDPSVDDVNALLRSLGQSPVHDSASVDDGADATPVSADDDGGLSPATPATLGAAPAYTNDLEYATNQNGVARVHCQCHGLTPTSTSMTVTTDAGTWMTSLSCSSSC